jgi:hypothetical protein
MNSLRKNQENNIIPYSFKKVKLPKNKFNEGGAYLYNENFKSLKKEINEDIRRWKDTPCL